MGFVGMVIFIILARTSITVSETGDCVINEWDFFRNARLFYSVQSEKISPKEAQKKCAYLNGQLLKITSQAVESHISELAKEKGVSKSAYWMGLHSIGDGAWMWRDGSILGRDDYSNFITGAKQTSNEVRCTAVRWKTSTKWISHECNEVGPFICEARAPCRAAPGFYLNGEKVHKDETGYISTPTKVSIACNAEGYTKAAINVEMFCEWNEADLISDTLSVTKTLDVELDIHDRKCSCMVTSNDGSETSIDVKLVLRISTTLVNTNDTNLNVKVIVGHDFHLTFDVYAFPEPQVYILEIDKVRVDENSYTASSRPKTMETVIQAVTLTMDRVRMNMSGLYRLRVHNGVDPPLTKQFNLTVTDIPLDTGDHSENNSFLYGAVVILILLPALFGLYGFLATVKDNGAPPKHFSLSHETYHGQYGSLGEANDAVANEENASEQRSGSAGFDGTDIDAATVEYQEDIAGSVGKSSALTGSHGSQHD